jgi:ABC-type Fe3+-hydroxamate transport system substrate-binding protein
MNSFTDQCGHNIHINGSAKRLISLVPSQTEFLFHLGLDTEVIGITRYCVHPTQWKLTKTIVGGTKDLNIDAIISLRPDLIIANKEENTKGAISELQQHLPVWVSDINDLTSAKEMMVQIGKMVSRSDQANEIVEQINSAFQEVKRIKRARVLYLIWRKPWMAAGSDTFINDMLNCVGLENAVKPNRYPELTDEDIQQLKADYIFLSSEPFPFREKHIEELKKISPHSTLILVDGEMFSWYGSRLRLAPAYFNSLPLLRN